MKTIMGKLILLLAGCLLLLCILPIPAVAWPPPCPSPCEYWNGYECYCHEACCYDSDCDGFFECYSCNLDTCTCEDDQSKCSGCCKCDYGMCVDDDDECTGCEDCSGCSCVDNDENCTGCMECENAECIGNPTVKSVRIFWKTLFDEGWFDYDFDDVHYVTSLPCWCTHYTSESNKFGHAHTPSPGFPIEHEGDTYTATMSDNWWDDYYDSYTRVSSSSCYGNCFSYATGRSRRSVPDR